MTLTLPDRAPAEARTRQAADVRKRRNAEAACALDFLVYGDDEGRGPHARRCICDPVCARNYDPHPTPEAAPNPRLYEGTGIAALYGLPGGECHAWQLAGWNLRKEPR